MLRNYLKIAWRNLIRNKAFSAINIAGLAAGLACSLLIMLWVHDERSVDAFHANGSLLYQVYAKNTYDGKTKADYVTQGLLAQELKRVIPEVQYASGLDWNSISTFAVNGQPAKMTGSFAGEDFFTMFSYPLLEGTPETALNTPEGIAISRKMAEQFFGSAAKAMGQSVRFEDKLDLTVTAVFENLPANSSQQFDYLRTWKAFVLENQWVNNWGNTSPASYVQLRPDADADKVRAKIKDFIYRYKPRREGDMVMELNLQPFPARYLHGTFENGELSGGRIEYVRLFTIVSVFILLIACINFMNLATARSAKRAREVGVRKVIGAQRAALIGQFTGEALLLTFFAVLVALFAAFCLLPAFNSLTGKTLSLPIVQPLFWLGVVALLLITGFVAGSYPAVFLSGLHPLRVLKGNLKFGHGPSVFRKSLVVLQFTLTIVLLIGMIMMYRQMDYIQRHNLGYDRENLVYLPIEGNLITKYDVFKSEAAKLPGVSAISKMRNTPTYIEHHTNSIDWAGKDPGRALSFADAVVGYDFVSAMRLQLRAGRDFSRDFNDSASYMLNEAAVKLIGFKDPIGQQVIWGNRPGTIIGVLKDFHFNSMHEAIEPLILRLDDQYNWGTVLVRTEGGKTREAMAGLEKLTASLNPRFPFTYQFSDDAYNRLYKSEAVVSKLAGYFAFLAIFISCLGLFGLAMFTAEQRTREIGVRKVMGASIPDIMVLLSKDFLKPVLLAMLAGFPLAWYAMHRWLAGFAYRTDIVWWVFALAAFAIIVIAMTTVSMQSLRAALTNPVKSLKSES